MTRICFYNPYPDVLGGGEKYFGTIPRGADVPRRPVIPASPPTSEQRVSLTDTVELPRVIMGWLTPPIFESGDYDAREG